MAGDQLGTKDVLEQVNTRLGNVEEDMRAFRTEVNTRFERVYQEFGAVRQEIGDLRRSMDQRFMWLYGLLVAVLVGVAGLWFK